VIIPIIIVVFYLLRNLLIKYPIIRMNANVMNKMTPPKIFAIVFGNVKKCAANSEMIIVVINVAMNNITLIKIF